MMQLQAHESLLEARFRHVLEEVLATKYDVQISRLHMDSQTGVLDVDLHFPRGVTRELRHDVLTLLDTFEQESEEPLATNPAFTWAGHTAD